VKDDVPGVAGILILAAAEDILVAEGILDVEGSLHSEEDMVLRGHLCQDMQEVAVASSISLMHLVIFHGNTYYTTSVFSIMKLNIFHNVTYIPKDTVLTGI